MKFTKRNKKALNTKSKPKQEILKCKKVNLRPQGSNCQSNSDQQENTLKILGQKLDPKLTSCLQNIQNQSVSYPIQEKKVMAIHTVQNQKVGVDQIKTSQSGPDGSYEHNESKIFQAKGDIICLRETPQLVKQAPEIDLVGSPVDLYRQADSSWSLIDSHIDFMRTELAIAVYDNNNL